MNDSSSPKEGISRRQFQKSAGLAAASAFGFQFVPSHVWGANERPTLAGIGTGGKGQSDINNSAAAGFQVVALVDVVDAKRIPEIKGMPRMQAIAKQRETYPDAKFYTDWRQMLSDMGDKVDCVTVSTPDHHHAFAAAAAMKAGKHVYCQKPLAHSISEARLLSQIAKQTGVKTQMGNQAHAEDHMRRVIELVRAGIIGRIKEVHAWTNRPIWPQGFQAPPPAEPVPEWLDWEQWIGPAQFVDYSPKIMPFAWRGWWNFGTGALGDMACHIMDMPYWALELGAPVAITGKQEGGSVWSAPINSTLTYEYAPNQYSVPEGIKYFWYDGQIGAEFKADTWSLKPGEFNRPEEILNGMDHTESKGYDCAIIGEKAQIFFNRSKDNWVIRPGSAVDGFTAWPKPVLARARNQNPHDEWFDAVTGKIPQAESNFAQSGPFTETVLLGCIAQKVPGVRLEWDPVNLEIKDRPDLKALVQPGYRSGWELKA